VSDALSCSIGSNGLEKLRAAFASMLICYLGKGAEEGLPWFGASLMATVDESSNYGAVTARMCSRLSRGIWECVSEANRTQLIGRR
jgi:hypothetical protein